MNIIEECPKVIQAKYTFLVGQFETPALEKEKQAKNLMLYVTTMSYQIARSRLGFSG